MIDRCVSLHRRAMKRSYVHVPLPPRIEEGGDDTDDRLGLMANNVLGMIQIRALLTGASRCTDDRERFMASDVLNMI